jgi:hypothetical protein
LYYISKKYGEHEADTLLVDPKRRQNGWLKTQ